MRGMRRVQRIAVAVVLAATLAGGGVAVADDRAAGSGLGRIAYEDRALTLDPADGVHVIEVGDAGVADASAPGWDTTGVPEGAVVGDTVRWSLTGFDGPGDLKVYSDETEAEDELQDAGDGAEDTLLFDSSDDLPDAHELPVGHRRATRWEFSEDGTYRVIFTAEATAADGRQLSVGTVYTVVVGDASDGEDTGTEQPVVEPAPRAALRRTTPTARWPPPAPVRPYSWARPPPRSPPWEPCPSSPPDAGGPHMADRSDRLLRVTGATVVLGGRIALEKADLTLDNVVSDETLAAELAAVGLERHPAAPEGIQAWRRPQAR